MYELNEVRYQMILRGGGDIWALHGKVFGHPKFEDGHYISVSSPQHFDQTTGVLTTNSGSKYHLASFINEEEVISQLGRDIENGGYEVH